MAEDIVVLSRQRGPQGKRGRRGHRGRRGERGERGERGHRGQEGEIGATGATGATGAPSFPPVIAAAHVAADGTFLAQFGFGGVVHVPGSGSYSIALTTPPVDMNNLVVLALRQSIGGGEITYLFTPGTVIIHTFDSAGLSADTAFSISVSSLE